MRAPRLTPEQKRAAAVCAAAVARIPGRIEQEVYDTEKVLRELSVDFRDAAQAYNERREAMFGVIYRMRENRKRRPGSLDPPG